MGGIFVDKDGKETYTTFLDPEFDSYFSIGKDNCGFPIHRKPEGIIRGDDTKLTVPMEDDVSDIVGRFVVTINDSCYDTVRMIDWQSGDQGGMLCEYYLDKNGRTILWRRFNKNDWANKRYGKLWTEMLPNNERLAVNDDTYVHWYDAISEYIL